MILAYLRVPDIHSFLNVAPNNQGVFVMEICRRALRVLRINRTGRLEFVDEDNCKCETHTITVKRYESESENRINFIRNYGVSRVYVYHWGQIAVDTCFALAQFSHSEENLLRHWWELVTMDYPLARFLHSPLSTPPEMVPFFEEQLLAMLLRTWVKDLNYRINWSLWSRVKTAKIICDTDQYPKYATKWAAYIIAKEDGSRFDIGEIETARGRCDSNFLRGLAKRGYIEVRYKGEKLPVTQQQ